MNLTRNSSKVIKDITNIKHIKLHGETFNVLDLEMKQPWRMEEKEACWKRVMHWSPEMRKGPCV